MLLHKFIIKFWNSIVSCAKSIACLSRMKLKNFVSFHFTLCRPVYKYIIPGLQPKTSSFLLPYQRHSSPADCAKELFKVSNGSASLLVCTRKKSFGLGYEFFVSDVVPEVVFGSSWLILCGLGPNF